MGAPYAKTLIIPSGSSGTKPSDWNDADNYVHCIGPPGVTGNLTQGGAGGAYAGAANVVIPGSTVSFQIGVAGGTVTVPGGTAHTWFKSSGTVRAAGATGAGPGTAANSVGDVKFSGGTPGAFKGGCGSGGPNGAGAATTGLNGSTGDGGNVAGGTGGTAPAAGTSGALWTDNSGGVGNGTTAGPGGGGGGSNTAGKTGGAGGKYGGAPGVAPVAAGAFFNGVIVLQWNPAPVGGLMKVWNGSAWVEKPVKVWNGSAWVAKPVKVWNGSAWVLS